MRKTKIPFYVVIAVLIVILTLLFILFFSPGSPSSVNVEVPIDMSESTQPDSDKHIGNPDYSKIEITTDNIQSVISTMRRPDEYYYETKTTLSYSGGSRSFPRKSWVSGDKKRIDIISENGTTKTSLLYTKDSVYMWNSGSSKYYRTAIGEFLPENYQMVMSYEDILSAEKGAILDAKYTVLDSVPCIFVEIRNEQTGYTSKYWISVDTGLLKFGETLDKEGMQIYSTTATETIVVVQDPSLFVLPNGQSVE